MDKRFNDIRTYWSWVGCIFVIIYLLWVTYGLIGAANCTAMILCELGKIFVSIPWILVLAPKTGLESGNLLNQLVTVSIVFNTITFYLAGMGLQKAVKLFRSSSK
jgi:hypothetical protein